MGQPKPLPSNDEPRHDHVAPAHRKTPLPLEQVQLELLEHLEGQRQLRRKTKHCRGRFLTLLPWLFEVLSKLQIALATTNGCELQMLRISHWLNATRRHRKADTETLPRLVESIVAPHAPCQRCTSKFRPHNHTENGFKRLTEMGQCCAKHSGLAVPWFVRAWLQKRWWPKT